MTKQEIEDQVRQQELFQKASQDSQRIAAVQQAAADAKPASRAELPVFIQEAQDGQRQYRERQEKIAANTRVV